MFIGYAKNNMGGTYCMLSLWTENIVLICDVIWPNKTYGEYISIKQNTKEDGYILKNKQQSYNWAYIKNE